MWPIQAAEAQTRLRKHTISAEHLLLAYRKTCVKRPLSRRPKMVFKNTYRLMQVKYIAECSNGEHSALVLTFIKLPFVIKYRKRAKIRNRYNQAPHLIQDTNGKVTKSKLDITNESQEDSPFPGGDHKALTNRRA